MAALALANCPQGDLNRDCKVDLFDFALMAESWLVVEPNLPFGTVIINEVVPHSHGTAPDWVELYNTSGSAINIGGWYLSDSDRHLTDSEAYQIPGGTTIPAYGYLTFYETNFGEKFKLSENGDQVYLSLVRNASPFGMDDFEFGASEVNVSFGHYTTSTGDVKFIAMDACTPNQSNSYPKVGPVVITEIMYYYDTGNPDNDDYEYIELYNIKNYPVNLWIPDPCGPGDVNWAITKGVDYTFPYHTTMTAHSYLVVAKDPTLCRSWFEIPAEVPVLGPFSSKLSNEGENVELSIPGEVVENVRYFIRVDNVNYSDGEHHENFEGLDPWIKTVAANGGGDSLQRIDANAFGDDVNNWKAYGPTPGL